jgi:hypothetical protein
MRMSMVREINYNIFIPDDYSFLSDRFDGAVNVRTTLMFDTISFLDFKLVWLELVFFKDVDVDKCSSCRLH